MQLEAITLNEMREIQLDLLKSFIQFCENSNIFYCSAYGTTLGSVRHFGYIPWDDDIDLMIYRKDLEFIVNNYPSGNYKIISLLNNKDYFSPLVKIYNDKTLLIQDYGQVEKINTGVYIDIFILDKLPVDDDNRKKMYYKAEKIRYQWFLSCRKFTAKSRNFFRGVVAAFLSIPFKIIGYKYFAKKYNNYCSSYVNNQYGYGVILYGEGFEKEPFFKKKIIPACRQFENLTINIPSDFDFYLKKVYGDYMVLPPEADRVPKHRYKAYRIIED